MATVAAKRYIYIFLALVFASLAALGSYQVLTEAPAAKSVTVFVAKSAIPARTAINIHEVATTKFPMASYPNAAADPVGKVVTVGIVPGEVIVNNMLGQGSASAGLSAEVPAGMYAMSIGVNQVSGVNGGIRPGDRVDLVASRGGAGVSDILPDVLVLAKTPSILTLEVSKAAGLTVVQAEQHGGLTVLLRGVAGK